MKPFDVVVAVDAAGGIGQGDGLPWPRLPGDLTHFRQTTTEVSAPDRVNAVIMGRKTWETIPPRFRPLPNRRNVVVTRQADYPVPDGVMRASSLDEALARLEADPAIERVFIVGGGEIYRLAIELPACRQIYLTRLDQTFPADTWFPRIDARYERAEVLRELTENGVSYRIERWVPVSRS